MRNTCLKCQVIHQTTRRINTLSFLCLVFMRSVCYNNWSVLQGMGEIYNPNILGREIHRFRGFYPMVTHLLFVFKAVKHGTHPCMYPIFPLFGITVPNLKK